jgi:hypothetical protein
VDNFLILGCTYMVIMGASALYLKPPTVEEAKQLCAGGHSVQARKARVSGGNPFAVGLTANEALKTWQFAALWWIFFVNITCGIGLLAVASPMAQEVIGMSPAAAASLVGIIGLLNGGGRIVWSTVSDYIGRGWTYVGVLCAGSSIVRGAGPYAHGGQSSRRAKCCSSSAAMAAAFPACRRISAISSVRGSFQPYMGVS